MKTNFTYLFIGLFFYVGSAQKMNFTPFGGEFVFNHDHSACLTNEQRDEIKVMLNRSTAQLKSENKLMFADAAQRGGHVLFGWPVRKAAGTAYNDVWSISGYVDHNPAFPNQLTDYNCGNVTYDTAQGYNHQGVDVFTWPFGWKQMDNNEAEIIAAAPGQIIAKGDGQYDRSCVFNSNPWNAVYVMHTDGSVAWYGHMKNGSLTTKPVGAFVEEGEFLGVVGSSGNSTGPHLHFEVYEDNTYTQLIDPYAGNCNNLNADSWWQSQRPYQNPNINAALTHSAPPVFPDCPQTETTNESNQFNPGQMVYFAVYLRDQQPATSLNLKIIRPNNTVFESWNFNLTQFYTASYWYWSNNIFTIQGQWKWEVTYQGQTVTHPFNIGTLSVDAGTKSKTSVYPNPAYDVVNIESEQSVRKVSVYDVPGKKVKEFENMQDGINTVNLADISKGIYFLRLESDNGNMEVIKIVKQ